MSELTKTDLLRGMAADAFRQAMAKINSEESVQFYNPTEARHGYRVTVMILITPEKSE